MHLNKSTNQKHENRIIYKFKKSQKSQIKKNVLKNKMMNQFQFIVIIANSFKFNAKNKRFTYSDALIDILRVRHSERLYKIYEIIEIEIYRNKNSQF